MPSIRHAAILLVSLAACGDNQDPEGAGALWADLHTVDYHSWSSAPGYATLQPTSAPHGDAVRIYVNSIVAEALAGDPAEAWPVGSRIVKDAYEGDEVTVVAAMEKRSAGWFWAEWSADGDAKYSGSPGLCTGCHESGSDFVRAFALPK